MVATTLTSWALLIWQALQNAGCDAGSIFDSIGLDPALLGDGNARYRVDKMQDLWRAAVVATENPGFGVDAGKLWSPTTFHALGFAWLASSSLGDALLRFTRYSKVINDALISRLAKSGSCYELSLSTNENEISPNSAGLDAGTAAIVKMCRMLCGEAFAPISIRIGHAPSASLLPLEVYARCSVLHVVATPHTDALITLRFDTDQAESHLPTGNSTLMHANEVLTQKYLSEIANSSTVNRVIAALTTSMPSGKVNEEHIADTLNMSVRSLQRKLREEGSSYSTLVDQVRQDTAKVHLKDPSLSLSEVAFLLGFSEQANFTRAFRRWFDMPPSEYRRNLYKPAVNA